MSSLSRPASAEEDRIIALESRVAELEAALAAQTQAADDLRRSEARLAVLAEASHRFAAASADLSVLSRIITRYVADMIGDLCSLRLTSADGAILIATHTAHAAPEGQALAAVIDQIPVRADMGHVRQVIRDGQPLHFPLVQQGPLRAASPPQLWPYLDRFGIHSLLMVPLRARGQVIGALALTRNVGGAPYTADDLAMVQDLADRAALVLAHVQLVGAWREATKIKDDTFALLNTIFASTPVGLGVLDADLRYIRVNQTLAAIDGLPVIVYPGRTPAELLSDLAPTFDPILRRVLTTGKAVHDIEIHRATPARSEAARTWLTSYYPVRGDGYAVTGVGVVLVDITERTQAEAALQRQAALLQEQAALLDHAHVLVREPDGRIIFWNQGATALYGWSAEEALERFTQELLQTRFPEPFEAYQTQLLQDGVWEGDLIHTRRDGSEIVVASHQVVFRDQAGRPSRILEVNNDITALRRAERALRERDEQLRLAYDAAQLGTWRRDLVGGIFQLDARAQAHYGVDTGEVSIALLLERVHPDDRAAWQQTSAVVIDPAGDGQAMAEYRILHPEGSIRWLAIHARAYFVGQGPERRPVLSSGTSQDITARKQVEAQVRAALASEQRTRAAAEQATRRISRLQTVTAALAAALTRDDVVRIILDHSCRATGATIGVLALCDAGGDQLEVVGQTPTVQGEIHPIPLAAPLPPAQAAHTQTDIWVETRADSDARFPSFGPMLDQIGATAYVALPLVAAGVSIGALWLGFNSPQRFSADDRALLQAFAQQCAQAIEQARLYAEVQEAHARLQHLSQRLLEAQEQERRHLARELHDEVGQALTGLRLSLELASRLHAADRTERLAEAHRATQDLIAKVRALSLDLRPAMLDDMGLLPALLWQIKRYSEQTGITVDLRHWGLEGHLPAAVETVAYRVVQEALTNIARYAHVPNATVSLLVSPAQLLIQVRDAGLGFVLEDALASGRSSGLTGMQERVALLNGTLSIETAPGMGTCVTVELPLDEEPR